MQLNPRPVTIFCGNLGSGKSEIAINFALNLHYRKEKVLLVDLDIINPYFRTRLAKDCLNEQGLKVICQSAQMVHSDVPALSPSILGALQMKEGYCVCDVGGDEVGAIVLGAFKPLLSPERYHFYFVVNACRPLTNNVDDICAMLRGIEASSRLKATALINNTNLGAETDVDTVLAGQEVVLKAAEALNLPLAFTAASKHLVPQLQQKGLKTPILGLNLFMRPPWADIT